MVTVSRASTLRVVGKTYSVPSRLRGHRVRVRLSATEVEVSYQGSVVERFPRLQGQGAARIDYRHIIHSLVRKPGAFRRYAFREALFPSLTFRRTYDALIERSESWADLEYVRILYLAATTLESRGESALAVLLEAGAVPTYEAVKAQVVPTPYLSCPEVQVTLPDLKVYDALLSAEVSRHGVSKHGVMP